MFKIAVVGTHGGWSSEKLADAVKEATGYRLLVDLKEVALDLSAKRAWLGESDLGRLDGLIIKKIGSRYSPNLLDRLEILRFLYEQGLNMYSNPVNIMRVVDRLSCTITLRTADIPMPPTTITESVDQALKAVNEYGQAVFKPLFTSKARGMRLIQAGKDAKDEIAQFKIEHPVMYIQQKIDLQGKDLGLVFLGGRYLTTYARCNNGCSWNTTTAQGGRYEPYLPSRESIAVADEAQKLFNLDFTCVDVVETNNGPVVFEVSAFGGFRGLMEAQGIDAAKLYTHYVISKLTDK